MRIVYIHNQLALTGGIERILTDKMNYLADKCKHEIFFITTYQGRRPYVFALSPSVKHIDLNIREHEQYKYKYPLRIWAKWKLNRIYNKELKKSLNIIKPDIIIGTSFHRASSICLVKCKAKKIIESHLIKSHSRINDGIKRRTLIHLFYKFNLQIYNYIIKRHCDTIVTLTQGDALEWNEPHKTYIIPNIITQISTETSSCKYFNVIAVGRLTYQKGFDILIKVWKQVNLKYPNWKLNIYGEGELGNDLKQQIKEEGLGNVITIHPPTPNIYQEMQKSSIFVFSSRFEGFGLALIEAMTNGIPCVSFDCPYGPSDIITDGEDGFLVPNGNIQAMADKICYLIENEEVRKEMGRKAHQSAMRYAPENIMPMWEKLFNEIVKS